MAIGPNGEYIPDVPGMAPGMPIQPLTSVTVRSPTSTVTRPQIAPGELATQSALAAKTDEQIAAERRAADLAKQQAHLDELAATEQAAVRAQHNAMRVEAARRSQQEYEVKKAEHDAIEKQYREAPIEAGWADASTGRKVLAAIGMMLGGRDAVAIVQNSIAQDAALKRARVEKLKEHAERTGQYGPEVQARYMNDLKTIDLMEAGKLGQAADRLKIEKQKQLGPQADLTADKNIIALEQARLEKRAKFEEGTRASIAAQSASTSRTDIDPRKAGGGGGVEAAKGSVNYNLFKTHAEWLKQALPKLSPEDKAGLNRIFNGSEWLDKNVGTKALLSRFGYDQEGGLSPMAKEYVARAREAADAKGRIKSGGAINAGEEQRFIGGVIPRESDTPKDLEMRRRVIDDDIRVMSPLDKGTTPAATPGAAPGSSPRAATPAPPAPARAGGKLSTQDRAAIEMAKARIKKNPADDVAKRVLDMHGVAY